MRVLICGGRDYPRSEAWNWLERNLHDYLAEATGCHASVTITAIIHGGARGADEGAADWAKSEYIPVIAFPADWKRDGKAAGPIRNRKMLTEGKPDIVVALPGGKGTADMVRQSRSAGLPVIEVQG